MPYDRGRHKSQLSLRLSATHRIENAQIAEDWVLVESLGLFQQLGLSPDIAEIIGIGR